MKRVNDNREFSNSNVSRESGNRLLVTVSPKTTITISGKFRKIISML